MKNSEFVARVLAIATQRRTTYMWGVFGSLVTEDVIAKKAKQYREWYTPQKLALFRSMIGKDVWAFDCVCLIKAVLWGWDGDKTAGYGGASYAANGVPDTSADGFIGLCKNVSADFSRARPGDAVWMEGHIGVYIGDGKAVECTPKWKNGVQITAVGNLGRIPGLETRTWSKIGTNPFLEYEEADDMAAIIERIKAQTGLSEDAIVDAISELALRATRKEDAWEKNGAKYLKDAGLTSMQHKGVEPVEFGELGVVLQNMEKRLDTRIAQKRPGI